MGRKKGRRWFLLRLQPLQLPDVSVKKKRDLLACLNPPSPRRPHCVWRYLQEHLPLQHHQGHLLQSPLVTAEFHNPGYVAAAWKGKSIPASTCLHAQRALCLWYWVCNRSHISYSGKVCVLAVCNTWAVYSLTISFGTNSSQRQPCLREAVVPPWRQSSSSPTLLNESFGWFYPALGGNCLLPCSKLLGWVGPPKSSISPIKRPIFLLNLFPSLIYKANCITPITEFLMGPDEGSSYLLCFVTQSPIHIFSSPVWLYCSYCCQQVCFLFSFLVIISNQSIFCIFIGRPQTCGLSSIDIESICWSQQSTQIPAPSHATPSTHRCFLCFPFRKHLSFMWWLLLPSA